MASTCQAASHKVINRGDAGSGAAAFSGMGSLTVQEMMTLMPEARVALLSTLPEQQRKVIVTAMKDEERAAMFATMSAPTREEWANEMGPYLTNNTILALRRQKNLAARCVLSKLVSSGGHVRAIGAHIDP